MCDLIIDKMPTAGTYARFEPVMTRRLRVAGQTSYSLCCIRSAGHSMHPAAAARVFLTSSSLSCQADRRNTFLPLSRCCPEGWHKWGPGSHGVRTELCQEALCPCSFLLLNTPQTEWQRFLWTHARIDLKEIYFRYNARMSHTRRNIHEWATL